MKKKIPPEESGSKGGKETLRRHGTTHFSKAARARWDKKTGDK